MATLFLPVTASIHVVLRVFGGIPGDLRTLIKHVEVLIIFFMPRKQLTEFEKGKIIAWSEEGVSSALTTP